MKLLRTGWFKRPAAQETLIYLALWLCIYVMPLFLLSERFRFDEVLRFWIDLGALFLFFIIHNFFVAPLLVHKKRPLLYAVVALALVVSGELLHSRYIGPIIFHNPPHREQPEHRQQLQGDKAARPPLAQTSPRHFAERDQWQARPDAQHEAHRPPKEHQPRTRPMLFGPREIFTFIYMILLMGINLAVKLYIGTQRERGRVAELEKEMLEQQLTYLRFQINPHFFMNTLNNIFALVDIEPEAAKTSLLKLSRMMRYALYESTDRTVPLGKELESVHHYLDLMRLRYTDNVRIGVQLPDPLPEVPIPPLILVTFLENAFKHGISFSKPSFVNFIFETSERSLIFRFTNSIGAATQEEKGGIGLDNVRKRLDLIYGKDYSLVTEKADGVYRLTLTLPR
ncbi:MAG: histidine kinase [Bacteroidales bacterium]|nr:histidine kinase [Bacteroidales bacterium]